MVPTEIWLLLLPPLVLTAIRAVSVWRSLRYRAGFLIVGIVSQFSVWLVLFYFTLGEWLTSIGVAGVTGPRQATTFDFSTWLFDTYDGRVSIFLGSYLVIGWLALIFLSRAMRNRPNGSSAKVPN